jgi:hypothetical protein
MVALRYKNCKMTSPGIKVARELPLGVKAVKWLLLGTKAIR